jgi:hypothetical protein
MIIAWRLLRQMRKLVRSVCGHVSTGPSDVFAQSMLARSAPLSPPPANSRSLLASGPEDPDILFFASIAAGVPGICLET